MPRRDSRPAARRKHSCSVRESRSTPAAGRPCASRAIGSSRKRRVPARLRDQRRARRGTATSRWPTRTVRRGQGARPASAAGPAGVGSSPGTDRRAQARQMRTSSPAAGRSETGPASGSRAGSARAPPTRGTCAAARASPEAAPAPPLLAAAIGRQSLGNSHSPSQSLLDSPLRSQLSLSSASRSNSHIPSMSGGWKVLRFGEALHRDGSGAGAGAA